MFCSGSSISSRALAGSPLCPRPILSTSSISTNGFSVPTRLSAWMILPGSALHRISCQRVKNVFQVHAHIPDVCASVTLDLRNVGQTSDGEAEELAVQSTCDRLADRRLSNTRGPNQANDFALDGAAKLTDSEELQDAILDVLEAVVVLVQNGLCVRDRVVLRRMTTPRNLRKGSASAGKSLHVYARRTWVSHSR